jgi:hypothetical protein
MGSCPDSVVATKKSSFFKLEKEREKREKKEIYHTIVCPKTQFFLCKTPPGPLANFDSTIPNRPMSRVQIGNDLRMESGLGQSNSRCATCSKQCLPFIAVHALRRLRPISRMIDSSLDGWYVSSHCSLFSPVAPTRSSFSQATLRYLIVYPLDRTKLPRLSSFV